MVEIDWEGTALVVFNRDIDERTKAVLVPTWKLSQTRKDRGVGSRAWHPVGRLHELQ